jgi:energy-converting hydrogenase Eha subunit A
MKPKKVIGAEIFPTPTIQLGDMVSVDYKIDGVDTITSADKSFVVYNIEYSHSLGENSMTVYLAEV